MELVDFNPIITTIGEMGPTDTLSIRDEPMLFSCDLKHVSRLGGKLTHEFIDVVNSSGFFKGIPSDLSVVYDCRTTLTMPGMYPSIPGWHCDDFNRGEKYGQPKLADRDKRIRHAMTIVGEGNGVSRTEFIPSPLVVELDPSNVWYSLDDWLQHNPQATRSINNREIITFSQDSIHRARESINPGWRFFGRVSITYRKPANEIRKQVQVYVGRNGW